MILPLSAHSDGEALEEAAHRWVFLQTQLQSDRNDLDSLPFVKERKATIDVLSAALLKKTATMFAKGLGEDDVLTLRWVYSGRERSLKVA